MSGVPQGSLIAPLLFNMFINNLPDSLNCQCNMYADDIKIYAVIRRNYYNEDTTAFQENLTNVFNWSTENKLPININKTHYMIFLRINTVEDPHNKDLSYHLGLQAITKIDTV